VTDDAAAALEPFRKYRRLLAELHPDRRLSGKLDPFVVVPRTMFRAYSAPREVHDARPEVLVAWLLKILARALADPVTHYQRDERDVGSERSLEADRDRSASGFASWLAADQASPSIRAGRDRTCSGRPMLWRSWPGRCGRWCVARTVKPPEAPDDRRDDP
jgi:hypothetical protein